jgi:hypothetical protein
LELIQIFCQGKKLILALIRVKIILKEGSLYTLSVMMAFLIGGALLVIGIGIYLAGWLDNSFLGIRKLVRNHYSSGKFTVIKRLHPMGSKERCL